MALRCGGGIHGAERWKASPCLPTSVDMTGGVS